MDSVPMDEVEAAIHATRRAMERLPPGEAWRRALNEVRAMLQDIYDDMNRAGTAGPRGA